MSTISERYEVSTPFTGVLAHFAKFEDAVAYSEGRLSSKPPIEQNPVIFDRMARKGKPELWEVIPCPGEAHKPEVAGRIDHCMVCLPRWGYLPKIVRIRNG